MKTRLKSLVLAGALAIPPLNATPSAADEPTGLPPLAYERSVLDGHQLLAYDERGEGRVVEVLGDLDSADRIAVVVPGSGHSLDNFWTSESKAAPRRNGIALRDELRGQAPDAKTAVVVWTGYDTPERVNIDAARSERAIPGARDLARLTKMLPGHAEITLIGHSYGTVVCGRAAGTARVTDVVALGSPGLDAHSVADLDTDATVWAARTADDPIRFAPNVRVGGVGHAANPADSKFGASVFGVGEIQGHDNYYEPGSESLRNVARIVLGRYSDVTEVHDGGDRWLRL